MQLPSSDRLRLRTWDHTRMMAEDAVRLQPQWPTLLSMARFARRATWHFGHQAGVVEWVESRPRACGRRICGDPTDVRLDFLAWSHALARRCGAVRELAFFSTFGHAIATVKLEEFDVALDELIWRLVDDSPVPATHTHRRDARTGAPSHDVRRVLSLVERRADFERLVAANALRRRDAFTLAGPRVATPLRPDAVVRALHLASEAGLHVRVELTNPGGSIRWTPTVQDALVRSGYVELQSNHGRMHVNRRIGPSWAVHLAGTDRGGPSIEAESVADGGWVRLDIADEHLHRDAWRDVCRRLAEEG